MSVLAVPKSMERSLEKSPRRRLNIAMDDAVAKSVWPCAAAVRMGGARDSALFWNQGGLGQARNCDKFRVLAVHGTVLRMNLDSSDIEKIAQLARLAIDEDDIPRYARELSNIFSMVAEMSAVDTAAVAPMAHPLAAGQRLRPDLVTETDQRELFQSIAPQVDAGLYLVPKVIE